MGDSTTRPPASARQFVGIDPGRAGGLVVLDGESRLLHSARLPWRGAGRAVSLDVSRILAWLSGLELQVGDNMAASWLGLGIANWEPIVAVERPSSRPREETAVARRVGEQLGSLQAVCETHRIPLILIDAREWSPWALRYESVQSRATKPCRGETPERKRSRLAAERKARKGAHLVVAKRRWPELDLGATEDGIAEAALIAEYARLRHLAQVGFAGHTDNLIEAVETAAQAERTAR